MNKNSVTTYPRNLLKNKGFSLIEIMITSFILALGLLGLAGMQSTAVKSNIEIQQRTLANSLVTDIVERMQLNRLWLFEAGNSYAVNSLLDETISLPSCVNSNGVFSNCTGEDIKNNDLYEWRKKFLGSETESNGTFNHGLINADACIATTSIPSSNGESVEVVISWYSTIKSKDAAYASASTDLTATCGNEDQHRRQLSIKTYISKSS